MTVPPPPINPIITIQPLTAVGIPTDSASNNAVLAGAKHGDVIEGFVVNRDNQQNPILRTPLGDILIKSDIFLKTGAEVQIRVDVQLASRARIIAIDGQTPELYARQTQPTTPRGDVILQSSIMAQARPATGAPPNTTVSGLLSEPVSLAAIILRQEVAQPARPQATQPQQAASQPQGQQPKAASTTAQLPAGTQVQVTIISGSLPSVVHAPDDDAIAQLLTPATPAAAPAPTRTTLQLAAPQLLPNQPQPHTQTQTQTQTPVVVTASQLPTAAPTPQQTTILPTSSIQNQPATNVQPSHQQSTGAATLSTHPQLTTEDIQQLLQASTPGKITPSELPPALRNSALAAQTLATQDDVVHLPASATHLPSNYRPFAGAQVQHQAIETPTHSIPQTPAQTATPASSAVPNSNTSARPAASTQAPATTPNAPPRGELMQVIGHEPDGASIIKGTQTTLKLFTAKPLPTGTQLAVEISTTTAPRPAIGTAIPSRLVEFSTLASHWPALDEALNLVAQTQGTPQPLPPPTQMIPSVGPQLTRDIMLFLNIVHSGDLRMLWPTQVIKHLEDTKPDLLTRLQTDMVSMQQLAQPAQPHQWAVYLIPLFFGNTPEHMRLFVRSDDTKKPGSDDVHNQRFIMELELSHLGDMQLDGFVQGGQRPSQFDLVIRTSKALPAPVEATIRELYTNAMATTRLKGQIAFQIGREHFIAPATQTRAASGSSGDDFTLLA